MAKKLCKLCHERPAEVPDRNSGSLRPTKAICRECHAKRLAGDMVRVVEATRQAADQKGQG